MNYEDYIKLGFKRTDINDNVEFRQTGYYGYILIFKLNSKASIEVCYGELDKPKLYVKKSKRDEYYITILTKEQLINLTKN